jgi:DNA-binding Xre family transcriptional regulator
MKILRGKVMDEVTLRDKLNQIQDRQEYIIDYQRDLMKILQFITLQNLSVNNPRSSIEDLHEELERICQHLDLWNGKVLSYDWMDDEDA